MTTSPQAPLSAYRLTRGPIAPQRPPVPDAYQRAVIEHPGGPLLVLAGPGTGKTTTLVEAVAARVGRGVAPEEILVLTFSRKASQELRDRLAARIGTGPAPYATTFHSFCYALLSARQRPERPGEPVRLLSGPEQDVTLRELLAGAAEDVRSGRSGVSWPDELRAALTTRGFADEVRAVLARSRELGLGPEALRRFAAVGGRPDWDAAARFFAEYLDVLDAQGVLDYAELVHRAARLAERPEVAEELRRRFRVVFVDEYQDTDPAQVRLLQAIAGGGRDLVVVGDPDQSIYAFRGADVGGILDFPRAFPKADGAPADVRVLRVSRRAGAGLLAVTREIARRMPMGRLPAEVLAQHRALRAEREGGRAEVYTYPTPGAELDNIADLLRRAHLEQGVPWGEMAVLVRSGSHSIPAFRRALTAAGVPLETDGADLPLHREPAVTPLLQALRVCAEAAARARGSRTATPEPTTDVPIDKAPAFGAETADEDASSGDRAPAAAWQAETVRPERSEAAHAGAPAVETAADHGPGPETANEEAPEAEAASASGPDAPGPAPQAEGDPAAADEEPSADAADAAPEPLTAELARVLLTGPLCGMDGAELRRLGRALREEERAALRAAGESRAPRAAEELVREALAEPERLVALDPLVAGRALRLGQLLRKVADELAGGATAEEALWALWEGGERWRRRLETAARRGGPAGRNADRDLDAVCALFETAARAEERVGHRGALSFLEELQAQDIAADTLSGRTVRPDAVRLMTAHRSKGLEWRLVVVAGVQEGLWPDLRRRGSLLEADRIGRDGIAEPLSPGALLAEERRLFYVAATRARERLIVTAVKAAAEDGDEPSRFLRELYREQPDGSRVPPVRVEDVTHRPRRPLAVSALVAELRAVSADPAKPEPLRRAASARLARLAALADDEGTPLVPSAHPSRWWGLEDATVNTVPVRDADAPLRLSGSALGQVDACALQWFLEREVRAQKPAAAAQGFGSVVHVLADEVGSGRTVPDLGVLMERLESVWDALAFDAPWKSEQEKAAARDALERFLRWHTAERGRTVVATEHSFSVPVKAGERTVELRGTMDRVEQDAEGRAHVVDFKTGKTKPSGGELAEHPQLGVYQMAVREGALEGLPGFTPGEGPPQPGGAELVHLRVPRGTRQPADPAVQGQDPLPESGGWVVDLLSEAADRVLRERFVPTAGDACTHCAFRRSCTAHPEGRQLIE